MNKKIIAIIVAIIVVAGSFYVGIQFGSAKKGPAGFAGGNFNNIPSSDRQGDTRQLGANSMRSNGGGIANGEIISQDDKSITIKLSNGGSKIILYSADTEVGQFVDAGLTDLAVGKTVMVTGQSNQDGSISAKSIQIRPTVEPVQPPDQAKPVE